jgi:type IV fimbrial biogenesis protein FimT
MVVVVIIAVLAAIAVPSVANRLRERRSQEAAERIAILYRSARMRAMGRGAAVFVRYEDGAFTVSEAVAQQGGSATCLLPSGSCNSAQRSSVTTLDVPNSAEYEGVVVAPGTGVGDPVEVCYTPLGRAYTRGASTDPLSPLSRVLSFTVDRGTVGLRRTITVLPSGIARITAGPRS